MSWSEQVSKKRSQLYGKIPKDWRLSDKTIKRLKEDNTNLINNLDKLCPSNENIITDFTLLELKEKIANKQFTCYEVAWAYCHRSALIHQVVNCLTEIFYEEALMTAKRFDEDRPEILPPLFGIPISLKDQCNIEGVDTTLGYLGRAFTPKTKKEESLLVTLLREAGAILYVKTTVPPSMMATETVSNVFGYTSNSINTKFSAGGSSGGEAALIAAHGSPLGIGTDIGGSIRIPASYHGLVGLRPSTRKVPYLRVDNSWEGRELIPSVIGPIARDIKDLRYFMNLVANHFKPYAEDINCTPFYFDCDENSFGNDFVVGIQYGDDLITPPSSDFRALKKCEDIINEITGFRTVKWNPPSELNKKMYDLAFETDLADAGVEIRGELDNSGEPVPQILNQMIIDSKNQYTVNQWWELSRRITDTKQQYREYLNTWNRKDRPRIIISPSTLYGFKPGDMLLTPLKYILFVNLLDVPSLSFPVTRFDSKLDCKMDLSKALNNEDRKTMEYFNSLVDSKDYENFPVSLQMFSPTFNDHEVCKFGELFLKKLAEDT